MGLLLYQYIGVPVCFCTGMPVHWYTSVLVYQGVPVYRYTGLAVYCCTGVYRCTCVQVDWYIDALVSSVPLRLCIPVSVYQRIGVPLYH